MMAHRCVVRRRFFRWLALECEPCNELLVRARFGASYLTPELLWHFEQEHRKAATKAPTDAS